VDDLDGQVAAATWFARLPQDGDARTAAPVDGADDENPATVSSALRALADEGRTSATTDVMALAIAGGRLGGPRDARGRRAVAAR